MRYWIPFILILSGFALSAQDMQYSQYFANPLYLNPAFTGAVPHHRLALSHRIQWPSLPKAFSNSSASYDLNAEQLNSGFGLLVNSNQAGSANLRNTSAAFNYSYTVNFDRKFIFKPAISFGVVNRNVDRDKLVFGDQIEFGVDGAPTQDPSILEIESKSYVDLGTGFLVYSKNLWAGASAFHLNQPNNSIIGGQNYLPVKFSFHAGARFAIGDDTFKNVKKVNLAPSFIYKVQGAFQQLDVGASFHYEPIVFGLYYRGMPFRESVVPNVVNQDALIVLFGIEIKDFKIGYSFDNNVSELSSDTGGAHEISIQYFFEITRNPANVARSKKFLPCPAFNN